MLCRCGPIRITDVQNRTYRSPNRRLRLWLLLAAGVFVGTVMAVPLPGFGQPVMRVLTDTARAGKGFDEVIEDLRFVITEHNYRITGMNQIGDALTERHQTPVPRSTVIHFCNLEHARRMLEVEPEYLIYMPCKVVVYEYGDSVRVATQLLPDHPVMHDLVGKVNDMLRRIVSYAVE